MPESLPVDPLDLLTVSDVAHLLKLKPKTIYAWAQQRRIPSIKIHGALRFRRHDLVAAVEEARVREARDHPVSSVSSGLSPDQIDAVVARARRLIR